MPNHENITIVLGDTKVELPPLSYHLYQVSLMASDDMPDLDTSFAELLDETTPQSPYPKQKNQRQKRKEKRNRA